MNSNPTCEGTLTSILLSEALAPRSQIVTTILLMVSLVGGCASNRVRHASGSEVSKRSADQTLRITWRGKTLSSFVVRPGAGEKLGEFFPSHRGEFGLASKDSIVVGPRISAGKEATYHYAQHLHDGVPVVDSWYLIAAQQDVVRYGEGSLESIIAVETIPRITGDEARRKALQANLEGNAQRDILNEALVIVPDSGDKSHQTHRLAWRLEASDPVGRMNVEVDATTGTILRQWRPLGSPNFYSPTDGEMGVEPWIVPLRWSIDPTPHYHTANPDCLSTLGKDAKSRCSPMTTLRWDVGWDVQVSRSPTFDIGEDPLIEYTSDHFSCVQHVDLQPLDDDIGTFSSGTFCSSALPHGLNLFPETKYYWRFRAEQWDGLHTVTPGEWEATHSFTTGTKQTKNIKPANGAVRVFPWPAEFKWEEVPGAASYRLWVDRACEMASDAAIVGPGATKSPTDIMQSPSTAASTGMDLDILASHCFTVTPIGYPIGEQQNIGTPSYKLGNTVVGEYDDFTTSGAEPWVESPVHQASDVEPWKNSFEWNIVQSASDYEAELTTSSDEAFSGGWDCNLTMPVVCSSTPLHTLTTYRWRTRALGPIDPRTGVPRIGDYADFHNSPPMSPMSDTGYWQGQNALTFTTNNAKVTLMTPEDGTPDVPFSPARVKWKDNGAISYDLQIHTQTSFEDGQGTPLPEVIAVSFEPCSNPSAGLCVYDVDLAPNTKYYWRVMGHGPNDDNGAWSDVWSFTTLNDQVECYYPCNGETMGTWGVSLMVIRKATAVSYEFELHDYKPDLTPYVRTFTRDAAGGYPLYHYPQDPKEGLFEADLYVQPRLGASYDWRVRAIFASAVGRWSNEDEEGNPHKQWFSANAKTQVSLCPTPGDGCPANGATDVPYGKPVPLEFTSVPSSASYVLEVCPQSEANLADPYSGCNIFSTSDSPSNALAGLWDGGWLPEAETDYIWNAFAIGPGNDSDDPYPQKLGVPSPWYTFATKSKPPKVESVPCNATVTAGGPHGANYWVDLGITSGWFEVVWFSYTIPDELMIYDDNGLVVSYPCIGDALTGQYPFHSANGSVHVVINGNCDDWDAGTYGDTEWALGMTCGWNP